jgi:hypothetical protein
MTLKAASLTGSLLSPKGAAIPTGIAPPSMDGMDGPRYTANDEISAAVARPFHSSLRNGAASGPAPVQQTSAHVQQAHQAKVMRMQSRRASKSTHKVKFPGLGKHNMLKAHASLEFILNRIQLLGRGEQPHERAAYRALIHMIQRWAEPTDLFVDEDLQMSQRIGQDLADIIRHISNIQNAYLQNLFTDAK